MNTDCVFKTTHIVSGQRGLPYIHSAKADAKIHRVKADAKKMTAKKKETNKKNKDFFQIKHDKIV